MNGSAIHHLKIKLTAELYNSIREHLLKDQTEQICYLFGHTVRYKNTCILLPHKALSMQDEKGKLERSKGHVHLAKELVQQVHKRFIDSEYTAIIKCHSHPFEKGNVWFSSVDLNDDRHEHTYLQTEAPKERVSKNRDATVIAASMVFGQETIAAHRYDCKAKSFQAVEQISIIGEPVQNITPTNRDCKPPEDDNGRGELFTRHVLAFGELGQRVLSNTHVCLVGVGGVGSIVAEGLVRLGVRSLTLIDPDVIEEHNLNRWQGGRKRDIGKPKVKVCKQRLNSTLPSLTIHALQASLFSKEAVNALKQCDVIIGGTDTHESRYFLNRLSLQYLIPYFDAGTLIDGSEGNVNALNIRMATILPGVTRCMDCSHIDYYDRQQVHHAFLDQEALKNFKARGYIKGDEESPAPSVYPLNMSIASFVLLEVLNLFTGYKPFSWNVFVDLLQMNDDSDEKSKSPKRVLTTKEPEAKSDLCLNCNIYRGSGDSENLDWFTDRNRRVSLPVIKESQVACVNTETNTLTLATD